jgi:hypothetical protein
MNKKFAFTVVRAKPKKMGPEVEFKYSNVSIASDNF